MAIWRDSFHIFTDHPWLGAGNGNFRRALMNASAAAPTGSPTFPTAEHAHNLVLQWLAEYGLPFTFSLLILFGLSFIFRLRQLPYKDWLMPCGIVLIIGVYSGLEYPLWLGQFLGPFALALGALSPGQRTLNLSARSGVLVAFASLFLLYQISTDYFRMVECYREGLETPESLATTMQLQNSPSVAPYSIAILAANMNPEQTLAQKQSMICERALNVWPSAAMAGRCARLHFMVGDTEKGQILLETGRSAFRTPQAVQAFENQFDNR